MFVVRLMILVRLMRKVKVYVVGLRLEDEKMKIFGMGG